MGGQSQKINIEEVLTEKGAWTGCKFKMGEGRWQE